MESSFFARKLHNKINGIIIIENTICFYLKFYVNYNYRGNKRASCPVGNKSLGKKGVSLQMAAEFREG